MLNPVQALKFAWRNKFDFRGRARRSEYWWTILMSSLLFGLIAMFETFLLPQGITGQLKADYVTYGWEGFLNDLNVYPFSNLIYFLTLPILTLQAMRRLHDTGRFGWLAIVVALLGVAGTYMSPTSLLIVYERITSNTLSLSGFTVIEALNLLFWGAAITLTIWQFILNVLPSEHGNNQFGPNPEGEGNIDVFG